MRLMIVLLLMLAGCSGRDSDESVAKRKAARYAAGTAHAEKAPGEQVHRLGNGALVVIEIPLTDGHGSKESQRCFVWRDTEFKSASLSCPSLDVYISN